MSSSPSKPPKALPLPWKIGGSVFAMFHLLAVGLWALSAQSGPWFLPRFNRAAESLGPQFATVVSSDFTRPYYLEPLRMTHNYHFESNKVQKPGIYFEVQLKNAEGLVIKTLRFPDEKASFAIRHRQEVLAKGLASDLPPLERGTQAIAPPNAEAKKMEIWEGDKEGVFRIKLVDKSEAQEKQAWRPNPWSKMLAHSYMNYLCREHKAASAALVRFTQQQPIPSYLIWPTIPATEFNVTQNQFGEYRRE
jgi:hypothetical protein